MSPQPWGYYCQPPYPRELTNYGASPYGCRHGHPCTDTSCLWNPNYKKEIPDNKPRCANCGKYRSAAYQQQHPVGRGEKPPKSYCRNCSRNQTSSEESKPYRQRYRRRKREHRRYRNSDDDSDTSSSERYQRRHSRKRQSKPHPVYIVPPQPEKVKYVTERVYIDGRTREERPRYVRAPRRRIGTDYYDEFDTFSRLRKRVSMERAPRRRLSLHFEDEDEPMGRMQSSVYPVRRRC